MNFLSKQLLAGLLALSSGLMLHGASGWSAPEQINEASFRELCFRAKARCAENVSGYQLKTDPVGCFYTDRLHAALTLDEQQGYSVGVESQPCENPRNFCNPTGEILYEDDLVRVIKKPGDRTGTDMLIVPLDHICNTHALSDANPAHCALLDRIWAVSQNVANYLPPDSTYTLMTNNGENRQGVYHLHVHFKSDAVLNEGALKANNPVNQFQQQVIQKPSFFAARNIAFGLKTVALLSVAVAAYKLYLWYKGR